MQWGTDSQRGGELTGVTPRICGVQNSRSKPRVLWETCSRICGGVSGNPAGKCERGGPLLPLSSCGNRYGRTLPSFNFSIPIDRPSPTFRYYLYNRFERQGNLYNIAPSVVPVGKCRGHDFRRIHVPGIRSRWDDQGGHGASLVR